MTFLPVALIVLTALFWGTFNFSVSPLQNKGVTTAVIGGVTSFVGAALVFAYLLIKGFDFHVQFTDKNWLTLLLVGIFEGTNALAMYWAFKYTTTPNVMTVKNLNAPFLAFIAAPLVLHESIGLWTMVAVGVGFLAMAIFPWKKKKGEDEKKDHAKGVMLALLGALLMSAMIAFEKKLFQDTHVNVASMMIYFVVLVKLLVRGSIFSLLFLIPKERVLPREGKHWLVLAGLSVMLAMSFVCFFTGLGGLPQGSKSGVLLYLDPIWASMLAVVFGREGLSRRTVYAGILAIVSGLIIMFLH